MFTLFLYIPATTLLQAQYLQPQKDVRYFKFHGSITYLIKTLQKPTLNNKIKVYKYIGSANVLTIIIYLFKNNACKIILCDLAIRFCTGNKNQIVPNYVYLLKTYTID